MPSFVSRPSCDTGDRDGLTPSKQVQVQAFRDPTDHDSRTLSVTSKSRHRPDKEPTHTQQPSPPYLPANQLQLIALPLHKNKPVAPHLAPPFTPHRYLVIVNLSNDDDLISFANPQTHFPTSRDPRNRSQHEQPKKKNRDGCEFMGHRTRSWKEHGLTPSLLLPTGHEVSCRPHKHTYCPVY